MIAIQLSPEELEGALIQINAYRERHVIEVWAPAVGRSVSPPVCAHDGIRIFPRRGGWRHDPDEVRDLDRATAGHKL